MKWHSIKGLDEGGKTSPSHEQSNKNIQDCNNKLDAIALEQQAARLYKMGEKKGGINKMEYKFMMKEAQKIRKGKYNNTGTSKGVDYSGLSGMANPGSSKFLDSSD